MTTLGAPDHEHEADDEQWRALLTGSDDSLRRMRSLWRRLPSSPRCKVCAAPFRGVGALATKVILHGAAIDNPLLCNACFGSLIKQGPGGAEIDVSVLFADIRGSTALAESLGAARFRALLQRFYAVAAAAVERSDGIVDKLLGDGVMALFIPVIAGENHRLRAIEAGRQVILGVEGSSLPTDGVRVGAGIQSGTSFVGVLGSGSRTDFSALGDVVNTAARLGSMADAGQLLVGADAWRDAGLVADGRLVRSVDIAGRDGGLETVILTAAELAEQSSVLPLTPTAPIRR